jgi:hypothetical protein
MYSDLLKTRPNATVVRWLSRGCRKVVRWLSRGCQNAQFLSKDFPNAEGVRDSVSFFTCCCDPQCRCVHISTCVRDAPVLRFVADCEISGSYEPTGGN